MQVTAPDPTPPLTEHHRPVDIVGIARVPEPPPASTAGHPATRPVPRAQAPEGPTPSRTWTQRISVGGVLVRLDAEQLRLMPDGSYQVVVVRWGVPGHSPPLPLTRAAAAAWLVRFDFLDDVPDDLLDELAKLEV